MHNPVRTKMQ